MDKSHLQHLYLTEAVALCDFLGAAYNSLTYLFTYLLYH